MNELTPDRYKPYKSEAKPSLITFSEPVVFGQMPEPGSPAAKALERKRHNQLSPLKTVGLRIGVSAAAGALIAGGGAALTELAKNDPGKQDKTVQINPNPETHVDSAVGKLGLTPEQHSRVNEVARGTALTLMQGAKSSGPDTRNGYGQLVFTKADAKNAYGQAVWVRAYNTVDGLHINVERTDFNAPDGELGNETKTLVSQSLDFLNPSTPVFKDGVLTSAEAAALFEDPNTVLTNGTREIDSARKAAAEVTIGKDGTVVAGRGEEFTLTAGKDNFDPLPSVDKEQDIQELLEWVMNK